MSYFAEADGDALLALLVQLGKDETLPWVLEQTESRRELLDGDLRRLCAPTTLRLRLRGDETEDDYNDARWTCIPDVRPKQPTAKQC